MRIAPRIALLILLGTGMILAAVVLSDYSMARRMLIEELHAKAKYLALATAREMEVIKRAVEKVVVQLAVIIRTEPFEREELYKILENTVREHPEVLGSAVALGIRSDGSGGDARLEEITIPYVHRKGDRLLRRDLASGGYPFETFDWYHIPRELGVPIWTEPYYDEGGGDSIMVTYAVPVFAEPERRFRGIVTGDLSLDWLQSMLGSLEIGEGGGAFIISRGGTFISHSPKSDLPRGLIMRESIFSLAEEHGREELRRLGQSMVRGETGFLEFKGMLDGVPKWLAYTSVPGTGWSLAVLFPKNVITANLLTLALMKAILGGLGAIAMILVALVIARSISRPIRDLDAAAHVLATGNLEVPLPVATGKDEVAELTRSFSKMRLDLKKYIEDLKDTTAAKARIESDLETARTIQLDLLPSRFTFDPPRQELDIYALVEPARAVGGDFYDFFWCDPHRLFVAVADVSGKGVPSSLFMAVSKAYLKAFTMQGSGPSEALSRLNDELAIENDEGLFLTVFCATIDVRNGACVYAIGGHGPPLILRSDGRVETVSAVKGPLIGLEGGRRFESGSFTLQSGDVLLSYSDGVSEAEDMEHVLYEDRRAIEVLARLRGKSAREVIDAVREDVRGFVGEAPQSDDITLLAVRYTGETRRNSGESPPLPRAGRDASDRPFSGSAGEAR